MLLLNGASNAPAELILTPRQGGPTPPNPNAPGFEDDISVTPPAPPSGTSAGQSPTRPVYAPPIQSPGRSRFGAMAAQNSATESTSTTDPGTNPAPVDNPPSPNTVQTPQQIYQQLQQLQTAQPQH